VIYTKTDSVLAAEGVKLFDASQILIASIANPMNALRVKFAAIWKIARS